MTRDEQDLAHQLAALAAVRGLVHGLTAHRDPQLEASVVALALLDQAAELTFGLDMQHGRRVLLADYARRVYVGLARELPEADRVELDMDTAKELG